MADALAFLVMLLALFQLAQLARGVTVPTKGLLAGANVTIVIWSLVWLTSRA